MAHIILFHSALGLDSGMERMADVFRTAGHTVHIPDYYAGHVFDTVPEGIAYRDGVTFPELGKRAAAAVEALPGDLSGQPLFFGGFSLGAAMAQSFAKRHPQAAGAFLCHAGGAPKPTSWNSHCWLQIHHSEDDPWIVKGQPDILIESARAAGATASLHTYPGSRHLFADPTKEDYDPNLAEQMWQTILSALEPAPEQAT